MLSYILEAVKCYTHVNLEWRECCGVDLADEGTVWVGSGAVLLEDGGDFALSA